MAGHWGLGADVLTDIFAPDASAGTRAALSTYQREAASPETAAALLRLCYRIDVTASLGRIRAPTLVRAPLSTTGRLPWQAQLIASGIPDARLRGSARAFTHALRRRHRAARQDHQDVPGAPSATRGDPTGLTPRQQQVAALVAEGLTNREIGERLGINERSAEGHLERIRLRLGLRSRAQVAAWWVATAND